LERRKKVSGFEGRGEEEESCNEKIHCKGGKGGGKLLTIA